MLFEFHFFVNAQSAEIQIQIEFLVLGFFSSFSSLTTNLPTNSCASLKNGNSNLTINLVDRDSAAISY